MTRQITLPRVVGVAALLLAASVLGARAWASDGAGDTSCVTVYHAQSNGDDPIGELCLTLAATDTYLDTVTVTLTAQRSTCDDAVDLHVSAASPKGQVSDSRKVDCIADQAKAVFDIDADLDNGAEICGSLPDDAPYNRFRPARTCVRL
jgi:hypothetical protein